MLTLNKKVLKKIIFLMISFIILCGGCVKAVVKPTSDFGAQCLRAAEWKTNGEQPVPIRAPLLPPPHRRCRP